MIYGIDGAKLYSSFPSGVICSNDHLLEGFAVLWLKNRFINALYSDAIPVQRTEQWTEIIPNRLKDLRFYHDVLWQIHWETFLRVTMKQKEKHSSFCCDLKPQLWQSSQLQTQHMNLGICGWLNNGPNKDVHILIPGIWDYVRQHHKRKLDCRWNYGCSSADLEMGRISWIFPVDPM